MVNTDETAGGVAGAVGRTSQAVRDVPLTADGAVGTRAPRTTERVIAGLPGVPMLITSIVLLLGGIALLVWGIVLDVQHDSPAWLHVGVWVAFGLVQVA